MTVRRSAPDIVAIVGASPSSRMVQDLVANIKENGYRGEIVGINPRRTEVLGLRCFPSLSAVPGQVTVALVLVSAATSVDIVAEAGRLGVRTVAVITAGFAEEGDAALERRLVSALGPGTTMYGPNCIGFVDMTRSLCAVAQPLPSGLAVGHVSVVSQSGGLLTAIMASVAEEGLGIDWCASIGNAAAFGLADAIEYVVDRGTSNVLCVYAEELADDGRLSHALRRAQDSGLLVTLLKPHSSSKGDRLSLSHTASLAEDDDFVDLYCRRFGIVRVLSVEELSRVAAIGARVRDAVRKSSSGLAVVGGAGGGSALTITYADRAGLPLAEFTGETVDYLRSVTAAGSFVENPVDLVRPTASRLEIYRRIFTDDQVGCVLAIVPVTLPDGRTVGSDMLHQEGMTAVATLSVELGVPAVISTVGNVADTEWVETFRQDHPEVPVVRGLAGTVAALARMRDGVAAATGVVDSHDLEPSTPMIIGEIEGRDLLARKGVDLARSILCKPGEPADQAFRLLGCPVVVVKADVARVSHKAKIGGVRLGILRPEEAAAAVDDIRLRLGENGISDDDINGFLVQEMVSGVEVLAGLTRSGLGTFLTIGRGGAAASGATSATMLLPVPDHELSRTLEELVPGLTPQPLAAVTSAIGRLVDAFDAPDMAGFTRLEVNPFIVAGDRAVAADVLLEQARQGGADATARKARMMWTRG